MQPQTIESSQNALHTLRDIVSDRICNHGDDHQHLLPPDSCSCIDGLQHHRTPASSPRAEQSLWNANDAPFQDLGRLSVQASEDSRSSDPRDSDHILSRPEDREVKGDAPRRAISCDDGASEIDSASSTLESLPNEVLTHLMSHLAPADLVSISLVCKRFYNLVNTSHPWRLAFSRYFPGTDVLSSISRSSRDPTTYRKQSIHLEQRLFTRLTALATWRSEYLTRTRLLRSLIRGKPSQVMSNKQVSTRASSAMHDSKPIVTYSSQLFSIVNHLDATWFNDKKSPRFIHGSDETGSASCSDPNGGKVNNRGLADSNNIPQFTEVFIGEPLYGLGEGPAGLPNVMAVSRLYGVIYGGGYPGGSAYYRSTDESRGRPLHSETSHTHPELGIPFISQAHEGISSVWIARCDTIPDMTNGMVGLMTGSTLGIVSAYALGNGNSHLGRISRGQLTAKWVVSPGVPITSLELDESYNARRSTNRRIWAVALNALGEVYYLSDPLGPERLKSTSVSSDPEVEAWATGRIISWNLIEKSRRVARDKSYQMTYESKYYTPRSSYNSMELTKEQLIAETRDIEQSLRYQPAHFRRIYQGWDMRRRIEVDFAGGDMHSAGESIVVIKCGFEDGETAEVIRFRRIRQPVSWTHMHPPSNRTYENSPTAVSPTDSGSSARSPSIEGSKPLLTVQEQWFMSSYSLPSYPNITITTSSKDASIYALTTIDEDPLYNVDWHFDASPSEQTDVRSRSRSWSVLIPGHRARFLALGTNNGTVIIYDMRAPHSLNPAMLNELMPLRLIRTDSPEISSLAVSALMVVHGGSDGLVQAWDVLASVDSEPLRTINSRFSSRARRRLIQAEASVNGVGINLYAAGAIVLDPDPTWLRGMVSLGTHLRYWSYSSSLDEHRRNKKRRMRRSTQRGSNSGSCRLMSSSNIKDYITSEQEELMEDNARKFQDEGRIQRRFGVGLCGLSDEEALRYAEMMSAEAFINEEALRISDAGYLGDASPVSASSIWSSGDTVTPEAIDCNSTTTAHAMADAYGNDLEEAIRRSLID